MQLIFAFAGLAISTTATAQLTYNLTQARLPGQFDKYHCWDTLHLLLHVPKCIWNAQIYTSSHDACAYEDYACHCIDYQQYSDIIEPLVFPPSLGGKGTCTLAELAQARPVINDMCNFFNATQYAAYAGCPHIFSPEVTLEVLLSEEVVVTY